MTAIRKQAGVQYKTLVKRTMVRALRSVFTERFYEDQFKNLHIVPEYPMKKQQYPAIVVRYAGSSVTNAGVGHEEIFYDDAGNLRLWYHRLFTGTVELVCLGTTVLDRDILSDAVMEILSFGWLDDIRGEFFDEVYGDIEDPVSVVTMLNQLHLNTDIITPGTESAAPAPWEPEDTLIYQDSLSVNVLGGFYNGLPAIKIGPVDTVKIVDVSLDIDGSELES